MVRRLVPLVLVLTLAQRAHATPLLSNRELVRAAVRLALQQSGLQADPVRAVSTRARLAGLLPQLSVRVVRGAGATAYATLTGLPNDRTTTDDSFLVDVRATWQLDRLVFDTSETTLLRVELDRAERRRSLEKEVLDVLLALDRARAIEARLNAGTPERALAEIETARRESDLEMLTGTSVRALPGWLNAQTSPGNQTQQSP